MRERERDWRRSDEREREGCGGVLSLRCVSVLDGTSKESQRKKTKEEKQTNIQTRYQRRGAGWGGEGKGREEEMCTDTNPVRL